MNVLSLTYSLGALSARNNRETPSLILRPVTLLPLMSLLQFGTNRKVGSSLFAKITALTETMLIVHYYGYKDGDLKKVKFLPCWHLSTQKHITLAPNKPAQHLRYTGMVDFSSLPGLLVARKLSLTATSILTSKSRRMLMPIRDELFTYE